MPRLNTAENALRLLTQASERLAEMVQLIDLGDATWTLEFNDGDGYQLEWSAQWSRLVLTAELGVPPAEGELTALNLALSYNTLWRDVGKLRVARDGDDGQMLLIGELLPADGDPETFDAALLHFETLRRWWTNAITRTPQAMPSALRVEQMLLGRV